jgi:acetyl esterase/lipase
MLSTSDYTSLPPVPADARIPYGHHPDQFGDLYLPAGAGPHPVALLVHGGCWQAAYDLSGLGQLAAAIRAAGIAVWSIEYRRLGGGGGWPATFRDVAAAADTLRELAGRYPLDLARVVAVGHSAGGHLALWLAGRAKLPPTSDCYAERPLALRGVLSLAGIADMADGVRRELCGGACADLLGGPPAAQPQRYAEGSPAALLPLGLPQIHLVGAQDAIVPPDHVRAFVSKASAAGDTARTEQVADAGHFEPVVASSHAWPKVRAALEELIM